MRPFTKDSRRFPLFAIQLALNGLWSVLFFGLQNPGAAAVEIVLLWLAILATLIVFWKRSAWAGWLLVPYLLWVRFAAILNVAIWRMNGGPAFASCRQQIR